MFSLRADSSKAFLPPYSFNANYLCNSTEVPQSELSELRGAGEITLFEDAFPAQVGYELWIDQHFERHYEPVEDADRTLRSISDEAIKGAEDSLRRGDNPGAERLSGIAISADDNRVEPLAIKAAIRRLESRPGEDLMAELAAPFLDAKRFGLLVDDYCASIQGTREARRERGPRTSPMHGVASMAA
ncbi:MAG: hypothetical protein ABSB15_15535 [Bryobacteraceae bacterium]